MKKNTTNMGRYSVVIPVYNHEGMVSGVIGNAKKLGFPVIVVDDGSTDSTYSEISRIDGITVLRHMGNMGKGAAIRTGLVHAMNIADWAITLDADGQHSPADAQALIAAIPENTRPIVVGMRSGMTGGDVPWTSRSGRGFSNFWVWVSGGPRVRDSQSGFRIYPLPETLRLGAAADRFQFEVEVLVKARWKGLQVIEAPVSVSYSPGGKRISHFRPFMDFMRNASTFFRLIMQRICIPRCFRSRLLHF